MYHSMATVNLNKSEDFVTNTTAASKYIPRIGLAISEDAKYTLLEFKINGHALSS